MGGPNPPFAKNPVYYISVLVNCNLSIKLYKVMPNPQKRLKHTYTCSSMVQCLMPWDPGSRHYQVQLPIEHWTGRELRKKVKARTVHVHLYAILECFNGL